MTASSPCVPNRIAFTIAGDAADPAAYSGAPASLMGAFGTLDVQVAALSTELPPTWDRLMTNVLALGFTPARAYTGVVRHRRSLRKTVRGSKPKLTPSRELTALRSLILRRRVRDAGPFARAIQFGSEYRMPPGTDYVTLDDATIAQLNSSYPYAWMRAVPDALLRKMMWRQRGIFRGARACCMLNCWAAESAVNDYGVDPARVHVVGTGTNRTIEARARAWDTPRFLFVGKDFERKNGAAVLDAFTAVRARHPRARLDLVGNHPRVEVPGVSGHGVLRLDRADETRQLDMLFAGATCLVMPSWLEPTGNVHAEALAAGIGSIGTASGGVGTVIGDAGVTVPPGDRDALVRQMLRFCEPGVMAEYGRRAILRAPLFTWRAVAQRILKSLELPALDQTPLADFL